MFQRSILTFSAALVACAAGCVGSPNPYRPGYQERPPEIAPDDEVEVMRHDEVPPAIVRHDAWVEAGRKETRRILGESSVNVWNAHRDELVATLGAKQAEAYLGAHAAASVEASAPAEAEPEASSDTGDEGGSDEWGDDGTQSADEWGDDW